MKNAILIILFLLALVIVVVIATSKKDDSMMTDATQPQAVDTLPQGTSTTDTPSDDGSVSVMPSTVDIRIDNSAYGTLQLTIKAGTTLRWRNEDNMPHTVTSDTGMMLNSGNIATGETFSFTFNTPGTYTYHCTLHPNMKGTVIVE